MKHDDDDFDDPREHVQVDLAIALAFCCLAATFGFLLGLLLFAR